MMKIKMPKITKKELKRFLVDCSGNYVYFVPLVVLFTAPLRNVDGAVAYAQAAIPVTLIGARTFMLFQKHIWYKLWGIDEF